MAPNSPGKHYQCFTTEQGLLRSNWKYPLGTKHTETQALWVLPSANLLLMLFVSFHYLFWSVKLCLCYLWKSAFLWFFLTVLWNIIPCGCLTHLHPCYSCLQNSFLFSAFLVGFEIYFCTEVLAWQFMKSSLKIQINYELSMSISTVILSKNLRLIRKDLILLNPYKLNIIIES